MTLNIWLVLAVIVSTFLIGLSKGGLGGSAATVSTPLLTLVIGPDAVGVALMFLLIGDAFALWFYWRGWNTKIILRVMPGSIVGVMIGAVLLGSLPASTIQHAIGFFVLLFCVYKAYERRLRKDLAQSETRPWYAPIFGAGTGVASTLANAGGPIFSTYMLLEHLTPLEFMGTSALYYAILNTIKIPIVVSQGMLTPTNVLQLAWAIPFVPLGVWVGKWITRRMDTKIFEDVLLVLLTITAIFLLLK
jgi:uncharacterized membrane protein YfcA